MADWTTFLELEWASPFKCTLYAFIIHIPTGHKPSCFIPFSPLLVKPNLNSLFTFRQVIILAQWIQIIAVDTTTTTKVTTLEYLVLQPWRPVNDVIPIHQARLRGQRWPTTGHSRTQRGTRLLPFPRGSGVTVVYKERIPSGTLHPQ